MNEGIDFDPLSPIGLLQIDNVVARMRYLRRMEPGKKIRIAKLDMKEFFRQIPLRRRDMARVTQRWNGIMNVHTAFTFGARSAPHVCSVVTNAMCDEMARLVLLSVLRGRLCDRRVRGGHKAGSGGAASSD